MATEKGRQHRRMKIYMKILMTTHTPPDFVRVLFLMMVPGTTSHDIIKLETFTL